ncbi:MAG: hypothetical protein JXC33_13310 [Deltaproteobacteria bacterium]|nr:hypothetical protein [Deltaproteobacteria bacterium]
MWGNVDREKQGKERGEQLMEKAVSRVISLPGVKAVYRNGELIYRHQEHQRDIGIKESGVLNTTCYENRDDRI